MTKDQIHQATANPVCCFLNEISAADTQQEALTILAASHELLRGLPNRKEVLKAVNEMVDEKSVTDD